MLADLLPGHSGDLLILFEPLRIAVRVVYRAGAFSFHHIIDACVIYSSALFAFIPTFSPDFSFFIPSVPDYVLVGGWVRDRFTTGNRCRFFSALQTLAPTLTTGALPRA